jgi:hypothetical protein
VQFENLFTGLSIVIYTAFLLFWGCLQFHERNLSFADLIVLLAIVSQRILNRQVHRRSFLLFFTVCTKVHANYTHMSRKYVFCWPQSQILKSSKKPMKIFRQSRPFLVISVFLQGGILCCMYYDSSNYLLKFQQKLCHF